MKFGGDFFSVVQIKKKKYPNQKLKVGHFLEEASIRAVTWYS